MKPLVIVFARAPRLGTVKSRLAAATGERAALRFHSKTLAATLRKLRRDRRFKLRLAVVPSGAKGPWTQRVARIDQVPGDLGIRMDRAFRANRRHRVALVGCDIPALNADEIARALHALRGADAVFGPATDGGYWLVAMGARRPAHPFKRVRWSTRYALADTLANFSVRTIRFAKTLRDVDEAADLISDVRAAVA